MKRIKMVLTAIAALAVVGGGLALKAKGQENLFICNQVGVCAVASQQYTTNTSGIPVPNPGNLFLGEVGAKCNLPGCIFYPKTEHPVVFILQ
jgi:hypothetical protein